MITESQYKDAVAQTGQTRALAPSRQERNNYEAVIDGMMTKEVLERYPMLTDAIKQSAQNPMERRQAILSVLDRDRALFTRINQAINVQTSIRPRERIKDLINMLREYVKVGDVEKKQYGEVMTPVSLVEDMMDGLPKEVWSDPKLKWLDPANGCGIFPAVVVARLMDGLAKWQPDEGLRYQHIIENMLYVCELQPKNMFLYLCAFDPKDQYVMNMYTGSFLEVGFQKHAKEVWGVDKFDVIVGNPPYQLSGGAGGTSDSALYHFFAQRAFILARGLVTMVIPSRWLVGGRGLEDFRRSMLSSQHIRRLVDYPNSTQIFPEVDLKSGVCYFLWDTAYFGLCSSTLIRGDTVIGPVPRKLDEHDVFIRDTRAAAILKKVLAQEAPSFELLLTGDTPFGLATNFKGFSQTAPSAGDVRVYASANTGRREGVMPRALIKKNQHLIDSWKVMVPKAGPGNSGGHVLPDRVLGKPEIAEPNSICTQTWIVAGPLPSKEQALSVASYLQTAFVRFVVSLRKISQDAMRGVYRWVPQQDWNVVWTDSALYQKYGVTAEEVAYIHSMVRTAEDVESTRPYTPGCLV